MNTTRMSNTLDDGPDLGPNCLPRLSADVIGRQELIDIAQAVLSGTWC